MQGKRELESTLQRRIKRELTALGCAVWKWESPGRRGVADLIVLCDGVVLFMEVKTASGRLSAGQTAMFRRVQNHGGLMYLVRSVDDAVAALGDALREKGVWP